MDARGFLCYTEIMAGITQGTDHASLPDFFKPILWSYDFSKINPETHKEIIIINTLNYGDLLHWRWLIRRYGKITVAEIIKKIPATAVRPQALRLASIIFAVTDFNYAPRGAHR